MSLKNHCLSNADILMEATVLCMEYVSAHCHCQKKNIKNLASRFILRAAFPLGILIMEMYKVIINNGEFLEYNHCQYMLRI